MKKLLSLLLLTICLGCQTGKLATGGAYSTAPGTDQITGVVAIGFYNTDLSYKTTYMLVDAVFQFERDNRALLWKIDPKIKKTLDQIRPQAVIADKQYVTARTAYLANPTPVGLDNLNGLLSNMNRILVAVQAVKIPGR